jgi:membrane protein YqaA with SNARE-associated domain
MPSPLSLADDQDTTSLVAPPPPAWRLRIVQILTVVAILASLGAALYFRDRLQDLAVSSVMGGVFNPWIVGVVGGVGQALGELTGYMAGYSGQTLVDENPVYNRLTLWMQRHGILTIFVLALIPNPVFDLGGIAAGALRFPLWRFLMSCTAGKIVKNIIFALAGYYGIEALSKLLGG